MKRFLIQCSLFGLVVLFILSVIEISIRILPNPYSFKKEWMDRNSKSLKTLILGSSYAAYGINPFFLADSTFNLGQSGQSVKYDLALLKKYIDRMPHLERVILCIGYQTPFFMDYDNPDVFAGNKKLGTSYYIGWYNMYMDISFSPFPLHSFELLSYKRAIVKWKEAYIQRRSQMRCDNTGYDHETNLQERPRIWYRAENIIREYTALESQRKEAMQQNNHYLEELTSILLKHDAKLIVVITPTYRTFYENIDRQQMDMVYRGIKELAAKYPNLSYYDYFTDSRFTDHDFYDANHLSNMGAEKLTRLLKDTLINKE